MPDPFADLVETNQPVNTDTYDSPMHKAVVKMQEYGWSPVAAAGVVGNLFHESGIDTNAWGDRGASFGLAQWNGPRRKALVNYANSVGRPADDFDTQIEFLNHELVTSHSRAGDALRRAKSPEEAAKIFSNIYERPGFPAMSSRMSAAKKAYGIIGSIMNAIGPSEAEAGQQGDPFADLIAPQKIAQGDPFADLVTEKPLPTDATSETLGQFVNAPEAISGIGTPQTEQPFSGIPKDTLKVLAGTDIGEVGAAAKDMIFGQPRSVMIPEERYQEFMKGLDKDVHPGWTKPFEQIGSQLNVGIKGSVKSLVDWVNQYSDNPYSKKFGKYISDWLTTPPEKVGEDLASKVIQGIGAAPVGVLEFGTAMELGGPAGIAALEAAKAPEGSTIKERLGRAAGGALLGGALKATGGLPLTQRVASMGAIGAGQAAAEGGDIKDITASAIVMSILATPGGKKLKEAVDKDTKPPNISDKEWNDVRETIGRVPPERTMLPEAEQPAPEQKLTPEITSARDRLAEKRGVKPEELRYIGEMDFEGTKIHQFNYKRPDGLEDTWSEKAVAPTPEPTPKEAPKTAIEPSPAPTTAPVSESKGKGQVPPKPPVEGKGEGAVQGKEPWEMTKEEFDKHWIQKGREQIDYDIKELENKIQIQEDAIKANPNDPGNIQRKNEIKRLNQEIENQKTLVGKLKKPSEWMTDAQYRVHQGIEQALAAGKPVPPEVLKDYPDLQKAGVGEGKDIIANFFGGKKPTYKEFKNNIDAWDYITKTGNRAFPLKEGESFAGGNRGGNTIYSNGKTISLSQKEVYDRLIQETPKPKPTLRKVKKGEMGAVEGKKSLLDDETGEVNLALLTPGLESGINIKRGIQSLVLPTAKSPEHLRAGEVLGSKLGFMHRNSETAAKDLKKDSKVFDKMGVFNKDIPLEENSGVRFMSDMSQGRAMDPRLQPVATKVTKLFDKRLEQLEKAEVPLENVRENYFPGMWTQDSIRAFNKAMEEAAEAGRGRGAAEGGETPEFQNVNDWADTDKAWVKNRVKELMATGEGSDKSALSYLSRKPFKGKESFRKGKVFDDIMTGVEFGLEPISNNPLDLVKLKLAEMDRSIMANQAIMEWKKKGDVKFNPVTAATPEGWVRINDKYGTVWGPPIEGEYGRRIMGYYVAKQPVAEIMNNYLSSSLYNSPYFGTAYKAWMAVGNSLNQFQLGVFSAFHAGFTSLETQITSGAEVIKDIYGVARGNRSVSDLGKTVVKYPTAMINTAREGAKILGEWNNPQIDVPADVPVSQLSTTRDNRVAQIAKAAELAGAGFKMERGLRTYQSEKMMRDWYSGNKVKAALRSPISLTELGMKPIMEFLVPRQKAGVFGDLVGRIIEQNPNKTLNELRPEFRQAWNRVDARLGQVQYDRLFINNTAKNVIQGLIRAPGWTGGTIAEVGGTPKDAAKFVKEWIETGKAPENIPDRVAYTISLLATMAAANGLLTYAFTGEKPKGMDYWAFRDGGTDDKGNPTRFLLPSYAKDIFSWYKKGPHTLVAKMHPLMSLAAEITRNRDYYNNMIYDEEKGVFNQDSVLQIGKYLIKAYTPFWIRGAGEIAERGGGLQETLKEHPGELIAPQIGIMPATRAYTQTPLDEVMNRYNRIQITRTPEQAEANTIRKEAQALVRRGKEDKAVEKVKKGIANKTVDVEKAVDWLMEGRKPAKEVQFRRLPLAWQAKALLEANPEEARMLTPLMLDKIDRAKLKDFEEAKPFIEQLIKRKSKKE